MARRPSYTRCSACGRSFNRAAPCTRNLRRLCEDLARLDQGVGERQQTAAELLALIVQIPELAAILSRAGTDLAKLGAVLAVVLDHFEKRRRTV